MKKIISAISFVITGMVIISCFIPNVLYAMLPGGLPMWSIGHYVAVPGGKTKLQCDGTGQTKCKVWNPPAGIAAPEDIEGFLGKDDTYYYFEASEESEDVVTNCQGGEIIMAIPINLFEEE